ncbi:MAG: ketopantoate reductase C-terminal domain-containing protein, partial [SAR324 cluster bacterium]|nr:ketopantoate reductase C-terminal domain-containing protein [SAR324 cluster bacterium]
SWQLPEITEEIKNYCTPSTLILPLQNGADASDILADTLGPERVLGGLTKIFSKIEAPGVINHFTGATYIGFGEYFQDPQFQNAPDSLSERCRNLEKELDSTPGIDAEAFVDIQKELWRKMLIFVSTSGVGTITRTPNGVFRSIPETREMLIQLIREILMVGQAKKVNIGEDDYEWAISTIDAMAPESNSSLFRDIQSNRPSELHSIHGFLVREAERLSVDVPALRFIYHCLIPQENLARES